MFIIFRLALHLNFSITINYFIIIFNLAFKNLRNDQTIARLNDLIIKSYDLMYSKEELKEKAGLEEWEKAMLAALGTKNDIDSQPLKYGEKRPPLRHT